MPPALGKVVSRTAVSSRPTSTKVAIAAAHHWRWKTRRDGPAFDCVIMMAKRMSTLMAPM
jgi:hypothetical protein